MSYCRGDVYMYFGRGGYTFYVQGCDVFETESAQEALDKMLDLKQKGFIDLDQAIERLQQDVAEQSLTSS